MPIVDGVGFSKTTGDKLRDFAGLMKMHVAICGGIQKKYGRPYVYMDLHAGPGEVPDSGAKGSPVIAANVISKSLNDYYVWAVDREPQNVLKLITNLSDILPQNRFCVKRGDNTLAAPEFAHKLAPNQMGVIFHDSNGRVDFDLLRVLSEIPQLEKVDILIYMTAAGYKRYRKAPGNPGDPLIDELSVVKKSTWLVRVPADKHQWTFLLGTNWRKFPGWKRAGFFRTDELQGRRILDRLSATTTERRDRHGKQLPLAGFNPPPYPTYKEYLLTPEFREIRHQVFERAGGVCERCNSNPPKHPHHLEYPTWGEYDSDPSKLLALCHDCHAEIHGKGA